MIFAYTYARKDLCVMLSDCEFDDINNDSANVGFVLRFVQLQ